MHWCKLVVDMWRCSVLKCARRLQTPRGLWLGLTIVLYFCAGLMHGAVVNVRDVGEGSDYLSGEPITLPAASLCTNRFVRGVQAIRNRRHTVHPATFDATGRLDYLKGESDALIAAASAANSTNASLNQTVSHEPAASGGGDETSRPANATNRFPAYLQGQQYVWFLQDVRHYTNYSCKITVDCPSTFYLLVDNRVNDYLPNSEYDDPSFGPPDTLWVLREGWKRVNTGLSPNGEADYVGIDEGNNGTINQVYAVYSKTLNKPGSVSLGTEFDGNIYCLVVSTNPGPPAKLVQITPPKQTASE